MPPAAFTLRLPRLGTAYLLSFLLHALILGAGAWLTPAAAPPPTAAPRLELRLQTPPAALLKNTLRDPEAEPEAEPRTEPSPPAPKPAPKPAPPAPAAERTTPARSTAKPAPRPSAKPVPASVERAQRLLSQHLYYPEAAIAQGLEGEVRLLLLLAADGEITQVDLAASSGHRLLDQAAMRAAWAMGQLPGNGHSKRELILPVIFRLQ